MDWRSRLADYDAAVARHRCALDLAQALRARRAANRNPAEQAALSAGVALAEGHVRRARERLAAATLALTRGRPVQEVLWSAPDDI